ncbi:MAG: DUF3786 domain-containing protein [Treponema sp.]|jgi:hypothetical protein|nr:DUF3786 domain-containing protein [Treponema sp.]
MAYEAALSLAEQRLAQIPVQKVCEMCRVRYENGDYIIPWLNRETTLSSADTTHKILFLHYLTANGSKNETGKLIAYREFAPALFYEPNFYKRAVNPLVNCFGNHPEKLVETGAAFGGKTAGMGDASVTINVLPCLPLTFIIWEGSEEFPPGGNILFDKNAKTWLAAEDLAVLAGAAVYDLINMHKKGS